MKISDIKPIAIFFGVITAISLFILIFLFLIIIIVIISAIGYDTSPSLLTALRYSISGRIVIFIVSKFSICWGGYVAVRLARSSVFWNSFAVGCLFLTLDITLSVLLPPSVSIPLWEFLINFVVTIPAALLGGYIGRRHL